jgi:hypothetical protein
MIKRFKPSLVNISKIGGGGEHYAVQQTFVEVFFGAFHFRLQFLSLGSYQRAVKLDERLHYKLKSRLRLDWSCAGLSKELIKLNPPGRLA